MPRKSPHIQVRALRHMREAQARGATDKASICEYAQAALEAEQSDADNAARAIEIVWAEYFSISPPL